MSEFNRRALYKNNDRDFESQRRNRNDHSVEIRKAKKEDQLQKRRNIDIDDDEIDVNHVLDDVKCTNELTISEIKSMLQSKDVNKMIEAVTSSRKKLSKIRNPPIDEFHRNGIIPLLVESLTSHNDEVLILEAAWALTNIASGNSEHTAAVVDAGAIPIFISLMSHSSNSIAEQSIWAVSNITGDSSVYRDIMVKNGIIPIVKNCVIRFWDKIEILRHVCWFISNLFRHKSKSYPTNAVLEMLPIVREIMTKVNDLPCNNDLTWALTYASDSRDEIINGMIELDFLPIINSNLSKEPEIVTPSLRTLGNIVVGSNEQADAAINAGLVQSLAMLVNHSHSRIVKEACWVASNICAGTPEQVATLVNSGVVVSVLEVLKNGDYKSQKEAAWVVSNIVTTSVDEHKFYLLNNNVFDAMMPMLSCDDVPTIILLLDAIKALFLCAENIGQLEPCVEVFEKVGCLEKIEELQNHASNDVYLKSYDIVKDFLGGDEDEDNEETEAVEKFKF